MGGVTRFHYRRTFNYENCGYWIDYENLYLTHYQVHRSVHTSDTKAMTGNEWLEWQLRYATEKWGPNAPVTLSIKLQIADKVRAKARWDRLVWESKRNRFLPSYARDANVDDETMSSSLIAYRVLWNERPRNCSIYDAAAQPKTGP